MPVGGPVPKRSEQRRRRNKVVLDRVQIAETVVVPPLAIEGAPRIVEEFYASLAESGQAMYYEPSDWQRARILCHNLSRFILTGMGGSQMYAACQRDMDSLLVTEAERRRMRLEVVRGKAEDEAETARVAQMDRYRSNLG